MKKISRKLQVKPSPGDDETTTKPTIKTLHSRVEAAIRIERIVRGHVTRCRLVETQRIELHRQLRKWAYGCTEKLLQNGLLQDDGSQIIVDNAINISVTSRPNRKLTTLKQIRFYREQCRRKQVELGKHFANLRATYRQRVNERRTMACEDRISFFREKYQQFLLSKEELAAATVQEANDNSADDERRSYERFLLYQAGLDHQKEEEQRRQFHEDFFREDCLSQQLRQADLDAAKFIVDLDLEWMRQEDLASRKRELVEREALQQRMIAEKEAQKIVAARGGRSYLHARQEWFRGLPYDLRKRFSMPIVLAPPERHTTSNNEIEVVEAVNHDVSSQVDKHDPSSTATQEKPSSTATSDQHVPMTEIVEPPSVTVARLAQVDASFLSEMSLKDSCRLLSVLRSLRVERKTWHRRLLIHIAEFERKHDALHVTRQDFARRKGTNRADRRAYQRQSMGQEKELLQLRASMIVCSRMLIELFKREVVLVGEVFDSSTEVTSPFPGPAHTAAASNVATDTSHMNDADSDLRSIGSTSSFVTSIHVPMTTMTEDHFPEPSESEPQTHLNATMDSDTETMTLAVDVVAAVIATAMQNAMNRSNQNEEEGVDVHAAAVAADEEPASSLLSPPIPMVATSLSVNTDDLSPVKGSARKSLFSGASRTGSRGQSRMSSTAAEWTKTDKVYVSSLRDFYCTTCAAEDFSGRRNKLSPFFEYRRRLVLAEKAIQNVGSTKRNVTANYFPALPPAERCLDYGKKRKRNNPMLTTDFSDTESMTQSATRQFDGGSSFRSLKVEPRSLRSLSTGSPKGTSIGSGEKSYSQRNDGSSRTLTIPGGHGHSMPQSISSFSPKSISSKGTNSVSKKREGDDNSSVDSRSSGHSALSQRSYGSLTASIVSGNSKTNTPGEKKRHGQRRRSKNINQKSFHSQGGGSKATSSHKSPTSYRPKTQKERLEKRDEFNIPGQMYFVEMDVDEYDFVDWTKEVCDWAQDVVIAWMTNKETAWRIRNRAQCISFLHRLKSLASYNDCEVNVSGRDGSRLTTRELAMRQGDCVDGKFICCISSGDTTVPRCIDTADSLDLAELLLSRTGLRFKVFVPLPSLPLPYRMTEYRLDMTAQQSDAVLARHPASVGQLMSVGVCNLSSISLEFSLKPLVREDMLRLLEDERLLTAMYGVSTVTDATVPPATPSSGSATGQGKPKSSQGPRTLDSGPKPPSSTAKSRGPSAQTGGVSKGSPSGSVGSAVGQSETPITVFLTVFRSELLSKEPSTLCFGTSKELVEKAIREEIDQLESLGRFLFGTGVLREVPVNHSVLTAANEPLRLSVVPDGIDLAALVRLNKKSIKITDCFVPRWMQPIYRWSRWVMMERNLSQQSQNKAASMGSLKSMIMSTESVVHSLERESSFVSHLTDQGEVSLDADVNEYVEEYEEDEAETMDRKVDYQAKRLFVALKYSALCRRTRLAVLEEAFRLSLEREVMASEDALAGAKRLSDQRQRQLQQRQRRLEQQASQAKAQAAKKAAGSRGFCGCFGLGGIDDAVIVPTAVEPEPEPEPVLVIQNVPQKVPMELLFAAAGGNDAACRALLAMKHITNAALDKARNKDLPVTIPTPGIRKDEKALIPLRNLRPVLKMTIMPRLRVVSWVDDENDFGDHFSQRSDGNAQLNEVQNTLRHGSFASFHSSISIPSRSPSRHSSIIMSEEHHAPSSRKMLGSYSLSPSQAATLSSIQLRSRLEEVCICGGSTMGGTVIAVVRRTLGKTNKGIGNLPPLQCFVLSDKARSMPTTTATTTKIQPLSPENITASNHNDKESPIVPRMDLIFAARIGFADTRALCASMSWRFADQMCATPGWLPLCKEAAALITTKKRKTRSRKDALQLSFMSSLNQSVSSLDSLGLNSSSASQLSHTMINLPTLQDLETEFTSLL